MIDKEYRFLKPAPFGYEYYPALESALQAADPNMVIHLIADRGNEIASVTEATSPRISVVASWPADAYLNPFMSHADRARGWTGYFDPLGGEIYSGRMMPKHIPRSDLVEFTTAFADIRNYIEDMARGAALPVYDLFATPKTFIASPSNSEMSRSEVVNKLRNLSMHTLSLKTAMGRYTAGLDNSTTKIIQYIDYLTKVDAALEKDPLADITKVRPVSFDVPINNKHAYEVFSMFVGTWLRANLVLKFIDARRKAKTDEEFMAIPNELIAKWWCRDNPLSDEELFSHATKNLLMRTFLVASQVRDFRGDYPEDVHYSKETLDELVVAMRSITNDLRSRLGTLPAFKHDTKQLAVDTCTEIIRANRG